MSRFDFESTRGLEAGRRLGAGKKGALGTGLGSVLEAFQTQAQEERKFNRDLELTKAKAQAEAQADIGKQSALFQQFKQMSGSGGTGGGGFIPTKFTSGGVTYEDPQAEMMRDVQKKELTAQADKLPQLDRARNVATRLESLYGQAFSPVSIGKDDNIFSGAVKKQAQGVRTRLNVAGGKAPLARTYLSNRKAFSSLISKGLGEVGVLTTDDVKRIMDALPDETFSKEEADAGWGEIRNVLAEARMKFETQKSQIFGGDEVSSGTTDPVEAERLKVAQLLQQGGYDPVQLKKIFKEQTGVDY